MLIKLLCHGILGMAAAAITTTAFAQLEAPPSGKWLCIIDKAAGILHDPKTNESVARAVQFNETHRFILTMRKVTRSAWNRGFCKQTLDHWEAILYGDGDYPEDYSFRPNNGQPVIDYRHNLGPNCFSSAEAIIKYYDRDHQTRLTSYDFLPWQFNGLPDNWMSFRPTGGTGLSFTGSDPLDAGPVIIQGSCQSID